MPIDPVCGKPVDPGYAAAMSQYRGRAYFFCSTNCQTRFDAEPAPYAGEHPGLRLTVGVMGSASDRHSEASEAVAFHLGGAIAARGLTLITGACPGLPHACARGAQGGGGLSVGISPALSLYEHVHKYASPADDFDVLIYTGSGLMGREVTNIRSSDMVVILGGRSGTLGEFAIAYDEGKLIGILEGSGGIADRIPDIIRNMDKETGARLVYEREPETLVDRMLELYAAQHFRRPSCHCDADPASAA